MITVATQDHEHELNLLAKQSPFTRDFANPPMSLKAMRKEAIPGCQVLIYRVRRASPITGFIWCRPMKPRHMPFSTVYYMGVAESMRGGLAAQQLLKQALTRAKAGRIELVCEDGNEAGRRFYAKWMEPIAKGTVGKDNRPYTRWAVTVNGSRWWR